MACLTTILAFYLPCRLTKQSEMSAVCLLFNSELLEPPLKTCPGGTQPINAERVLTYGEIIGRPKWDQ